MIYTDGVHLITDSSDLDELHNFAKDIGLKRVHFQRPRWWQPHYDIWGKPKEKAMKLAKVIDEFELVDILKKVWNTDPTKTISDFQRKLMENSKPLEPEILENVNEHYWDLF